MSPAGKTAAAAVDPFCVRMGHKYQQVTDAVTRKNVAQPPGVIIEHAFVCTQCGDVIRREVAFWPKKTDKVEAPF